MTSNQTALVSFIGKGRPLKPGEPHSYEHTAYAFPPAIAGGAPVEYATSFFGSALLRYLRERLNINVTDWLVMGTESSQWSELWLALDDPLSHADLHARYDDVAAQAQADRLSPETLADWTVALNGHSPVRIHTSLVDKGLDPKGHREICRILFDHVPKRSDVIFDITHGFRHQPVIAGFAVGFMRRTHGLGRVRFFYGAFEAVAPNQSPKPVVEMDVCEDLLCNTEGAAVLQTTGNYEPLAERLGVDASHIWFYDSTNQLEAHRGPLDGFVADLEARQHGEPVASQSARLILEEMDHWRTASDFASRLRSRVDHAKRSHDFLQAALLAYEGIVTGAVRRMEFPRARSGREERDLARSWLLSSLPRAERAIFGTLKDVRNACAHGDAPATAGNWGYAYAPSAVLSDPERFRRLINESMEQVFDRLATLVPPGTVVASSETP